MFSVRLRIPIEHIKEEFGKCINLHDFFEKIEPSSDGLYNTRVASIVFMDSKRSNPDLVTEIKGENTCRKPIQGSLTLVMKMENVTKPIVAKWFVPKDGRGHNIHIANGLEIEKIVGLLQWLAKEYGNYETTADMVEIEAVNSKMEIVNISELDLGALAAWLIRMDYNNVNYNSETTPPKICFDVGHRGKAIIFRTGNINIMGMKVDIVDNVTDFTNNIRRELESILGRYVRGSTEEVADLEIAVQNITLNETI